MSELELQTNPHRRYNPLTREWVLVSPQRTERPWQGQVEDVRPQRIPDYDPACFLCPGNERAGGGRNPAYENTFVFDNDFAALQPGTPAQQYAHGLLIAEGEPGICRVVCFSARHDLTLSAMNSANLRRVVDVWVEQFQELGAMPFINSVQIFENRGALMGASNPHPHCQIWAEKSLPNEVLKEVASLGEYLARNQTCLLCDYLSTENEKQERLSCENEHFVALVPFWAVWPFEILVVGRRHASAIDQLMESERDALVDILKQVIAEATEPKDDYRCHKCEKESQPIPELHLKFIKSIDFATEASGLHCKIHFIAKVETFGQKHSNACSGELPGFMSLKFPDHAAAPGFEHIVRSLEHEENITISHSENDDKNHRHAHNRKRF